VKHADASAETLFELGDLRVTNEMPNARYPVGIDRLGRTGGDVHGGNMMRYVLLNALLPVAVAVADKRNC